jgi:hypothetical protein
MCPVHAEQPCTRCCRTIVIKGTRQTRTPCFRPPELVSLVTRCAVWPVSVYVPNRRGFFGHILKAQKTNRQENEVGDTFITHGRNKKSDILIGFVTGSCHFGYRGINWRIILKWIFEIE